MTPESEPISRRRVLAITLLITAVLLLGSGGLSRLAHANAERARANAIAEATVAAETTRVAEATFEAGRETVARNFENTSSIAIRDGTASPYPSEIEVSGLNQAELLDLDLALHGFRHTYPDDVDILLVAPNGKSAIVMSDAGGDGDADDLTIVLTEDQAAELPDDGFLGSDSEVVRYNPANHVSGDTFSGAPSFGENTSLSDFAGDDPNGIWQLYVRDHGDQDVGCICEGWELRFNARVQR